MRIIIAFLLAFSSLSAAIFSDLNTSPRALGVSGAFVASAEGLESVHFNPAGITEVDNLEVLTYYKHLYSGLSVGLHNMAIGVAKRFGKNVLALDIQDFGANLKGEYEGRYAEDAITLTYGYSLSKYLRLGLNLNLFHLQEPRFGSANTFGVDIGVISTLYHSWRLGIFIQNVNAPCINGRENSYNLPRFISFGLAFRPIKNCKTEISIRKEEDFPARFMMGHEVSLFGGAIDLRGGLFTEGELTKFSFGVDFNRAPITVKYAMQFDPNLPLTHIIGISYRR